MTETKTILLIDDEEDIRVVLGDKFKKEGFHVLTAADGEEGLRTALEKKPDLILLDVIMPKMSGFEMLENLRKDEWGRSVRVIFLTVVGDIESISRAISDGGYEYLVKSDWSLDDVVKKVKKALA